MAHWATQAFFYHIYPLGLCGAPLENDFRAAPRPRLERIYGWLDHLQAMGVNALYLGPLFESSSHGYDTADYFTVDRRLGTNDTLADLSSELKRRGMRLVLDGVFHHVGRHFWAFRDLQENGRASRFKDWFHGLDFNASSPYGDPFTYHAWRGHFNLIKLELSNPDVVNHLFHAVSDWMDRYGLDGLRLDVADCLDHEFMKKLSAFTKAKNPEFWLMGEVIHGDYRDWVSPEKLDSVTNYECYKGLYSSHLDTNYFEIAYSLKRQFGDQGLYRDLLLYNFADNHDVDRVAGQLKHPGHLHTLYTLLFTMPGIPSLYYGSEWGLTGRKTNGNDNPLRPALDLAHIQADPPQPGLFQTITRLAEIRSKNQALRRGNYQQLHVNHQQLAYLRQSENQSLVIAVNAADHPVSLDLPIPTPGRHLQDLLDPTIKYPLQNGKARIENIPPNWSRIMEVQ